MNVSVILATKDRGSAIAETMASLLGQSFPGNDFEIIIVDNRSTARNAKILQEFHDENPDLVRYVREEKIGLSNARNCGIRNSRGAILVFIDDDAIAPRYWLENITRAFKADPDVYAVGGKVSARFITAPPEWLDERLGMFISNFDHGSVPVKLLYNEYPRGANMAFRREAFERYGCFLDCFGRKGNSLMSYEEIELCYRIEKAGHAILYLPDAEVDHLIRGDRLNKKWFKDRFYWQGRSEGLFELIHYGHAYAFRSLFKKVKHYVTLKDRYDRLFNIGYCIAIILNFLKRDFR